MKIYVGIDPGFTGGIAAIDEENRIVASHRMPVVEIGKSKKWYDENRIREIISGLKDQAEHIMAVIEQQHSFPKQGIVATGKLMCGYGFLRGLVVGLGIPYITPPSRTWTRQIYSGIIGEGKGRSILACERLFPDCDLTPGNLKKPHHGIADGFLLAYYGKTKETG